MRLALAASLPRLVVVAAVAAVSFAAGAAYVASGAAPPVTFSACLSPWGALSSVTISPAPPKACPRGQAAVTWNQQGPAGPRGTAAAGAPLVCPDCALDNPAMGGRLAGKDLTGAYLPHAEVTGVSFAGSDLTGAYLATLRGNTADFTGANLTGAVLDDAELYRADLTGANLTGASLRRVSLGATVLTGATWSNTTCPDGTNSDGDGGTCAGHLSW